VDSVLGLGEIPDDGPDLPRGCVPYLPSAVATLLRVVDRAPVRSSDVFVDVGSGVGRAIALVHLLTGAPAVGVEIQAGLVRTARDLMARLELSRVSCVEGDGSTLSGVIDAGSVFFLYCPFSGERLAKLLVDLERIARSRTIRVCAVDVPLPACPWLTPEEAEPSGGLALYRSRA
jgi:SAM-dependent methyltransferase